MEWDVALTNSAFEDLEWFGAKTGRFLLKESIRILSVDPLAETRNLKSLRPNPVAQRELRLAGNFRVLFNVDRDAHSVLVVSIGEKRGNRLIVRGEEFTKHHESDSAE